MDTKILNSSMEDVDIIAESASFELTPETLIINGEGDLAIAKIEMKNSDSIRISGTFEKVKAKYSLEYLKKMIDPKVAKDVTLEFKTDYPIRMSYVTDQFSLSYVLAPRVDND
jgi:hypothetical protein